MSIDLPDRAAWRLDAPADRKERTMTSDGPDALATDEMRTDTLIGRLFEASLGAMDIAAVHIGDRLGLYRDLAASGPASPAELAARTGMAERYAREWLEQQAVSGILDVADDGGSPGDRRYALPAAHAAALIDPDSLSSIAPLARAVVAAISTMPRLLDAYRTGGGVPWSAYGPDMIEAQGDFNRPWILQRLATEYLPSIADVHARLTAEPPARVADVACGVGWASIAIAHAYPNVRIDGYDPDPSSIDIARTVAAKEGLADRVGFQVRDAVAMAESGPYDLAIVVEAIHDMSRPVDVLRAIHRGLAPDGTLIVADERVGDVFTADPGDAVERLMYGFSLLVCLPAAMDDQPSAATGTVMRPDTFRGYALEAGFREVQVLDDIEHDTLRFYRVYP
jgi:SAM-dependent methyltransferase